jgi:ABC-2 type transport system ATP-binding protein
LCAAQVIEFLEATKEYSSVKRIGPVSFSVAKGEVVGFLGPNGSGKTTCIRLLFGLMTPSSGAVRLRGLDPVLDHASALEHVGYSPELPNLPTFLTPRELLNLVASELRVGSADTNKEIKDILELVGLSEYTDVKISKFSKGMVQRLSIAQGMVGSPDLLVMDEPMIGLDPAGAAHFREVFRDFAKNRGGTILLSSHIMQEVESLCTSVCMIHRGRILFSGPVGGIIESVLGSNFLIVELGPANDSILASLGNIPGVEDVRTKSATATTSTLELRVKPGVEVRPLVAEAVMQSGAKLYTLNYAENLLERTYIEALRQGKVEEAVD